MTPSMTDLLCTRCGLCCNGTLFADVELVGRAEAIRLEVMGLDVEGDEGDAGLLSQPCAALTGTRCRIYAHRPKCCRVFECQLLQDAQNGEVTAEAAIERIAGAQAQIRRVRELLARLGQRDTRLPLKERCAEALAGGPGRSPETARRRDELATAMADVERTIWRTFLGSGRPRKRPLAR